jgi:hypothetical protein
MATATKERAALLTQREAGAILGVSQRTMNGFSRPAPSCRSTFPDWADLDTVAPTSRP